MLEDLLDGVGDLVTNTVTGNEGHLEMRSRNETGAARWHGTYGVDAAILGG